MCRLQIKFSYSYCYPYKQTSVNLNKCTNHLRVLSAKCRSFFVSSQYKYAIFPIMWIAVIKKGRSHDHLITGIPIPGKTLLILKQPPGLNAKTITCIFLLQCLHIGYHTVTVCMWCRSLVQPQRSVMLPERPWYHIVEGIGTTTGAVSSAAPETCATITSR